MQLAALRRPTAGIRSCSCTASTRDRRALSYMDVERGLSPATIATVRQSLRKFFKHTRVQQLAKLKIADVERFFVLLGKQGWTRHGIRSIAHQLRMFFRYGEEMGWTKPGHQPESSDLGQVFDVETPAMVYRRKAETAGHQ